MRLTVLFISLALFGSCKNEKERKIVGKWNAAQLVECDDVVPIAYSSINIEFKPNGQYVFNSTLNVHEEGEFQIKNNHLYTLDKVRDKAVQKIVRIQQLTQDTLVLEMNYKGKEQWLTLVRNNNTEGVAATSQPTPAAQPSANQPAVNASPAQAAPAAIATSVATAAVAATTPTPTPAAEPEKKKTLAEIQKEDKEKHDAYMKREAQRKKEEAEEKRRLKEKREAYLEREKERKKEEAKRKKKSKK